MYKILLVLISGHVLVCSETCPSGKKSCGPDASRPCIRESLLCDGRNNCGNNNDEEYCGEFYTITVTVIFHTLHYCYLTGVYTENANKTNCVELI